MTCTPEYIKALSPKNNVREKLTEMHNSIFNELKASKLFNVWNNMLFLPQPGAGKYASAKDGIVKINEKYGKRVADTTFTKEKSKEYVYVNVRNLLPEAIEQTLPPKQGELFFQTNPNEINYALKASSILASNKAIEWFKKADKHQWRGDTFWNKLSTELQIPKEQVDLLKSLNIDNSYNREQLLTSLLANYSYTIEINTAKTANTFNSKVDEYGNDERDMFDDENNSFYFNGYLYEKDTKHIPFGFARFKDNKWESISSNNYWDTLEQKEKEGEISPTQYYSNLTVPGGTAYTENEISTPLITPSIKGHAQFATDNGIGWFRSDDKVKVLKRTEQVVSIKDVPNNFYFEQVSPFDQSVTKVQVNKTNTGWEFIVNNKDKYNKKDFEVINAYNNYYRTGYSNENAKEPKTRRILEVQSDIFQKGRDIKSPDEIINELKKSGKLQIKCD